MVYQHQVREVSSKAGGWGLLLTLEKAQRQNTPFQTREKILARRHGARVANPEIFQWHLTFCGGN